MRSILPIYAAASFFVAHLVLGGAANALSVTFLPGSSVFIEAVDGGISDIETRTAQFPLLSTDVAVSGSSTAIWTYEFSETGLNFDFLHQRDGDSNAGALNDLGRSGATLTFTVDEDVRFILDGMYDATGPANRLELTASLEDLSVPNGLLFSSSQVSLSTPDEKFILGLEEGDSSNELEGSLRGTLLAGNTYQLVFFAGTEAVIDDTGGDAFGSFNLTFVPEPSTFVLLALGAGGLVWARGSSRTRRRRAALEVRRGAS